MYNLNSLVKCIRMYGGSDSRRLGYAGSPCRAKDIHGKDVTPFVLTQVNKVTGGKSLQANVALIKNNARIGGQIAVELTHLRRRRRLKRPRSESREEGPAGVAGKNKTSVRVGVDGGKEKTGVVVVGASVADFTAKFLQSHIQKGATNRGSVALSHGGVARNIAECMSRLGAPPLLVTAVGKDRTGQLICDHLLECGLSVAGVCNKEEERTATYCVVLDHNGEFYMGIGDMDITNTISVDWVQNFSAELAGASHVCMDGNIPEDTMRFILEHCSAHNTPVWFEPTCVLKSTKPMSMLQELPGAIQVATPNLQELRSMCEVISGRPASNQSIAGLPVNEMTLKEKLVECSVLVRPVMTRIPLLMVSLGKDGVLCCCSGNYQPHPSLDFSHLVCESLNFIESQGPDNIRCIHCPVITNNRISSDILSVSGAGDSFVGGTLAALVSKLGLDCAIKVGLQTAALSLQSMSAISPLVDSALLQPDSLQHTTLNPVQVHL